MARYFLGLDSSTQSLTATLIDLDAQRVVTTTSLAFDAALPSYGTAHGVLPNPDPQIAHAPPLMWADALDLLFSKLRDEGAPLAEILAVAGSGQQHGSVYLNATASAAFAQLDPQRPLAAQLAGTLARPTSPIWMDSSTTAECAEIRDRLGGAVRTAELTGSTTFERFTGPQIRKFAKTEPDAYAQTAQIALVSSFMASLLAGKIAPIDPGDGAGMNLMDIRSRRWLPEALDATAPDLSQRLPPLAPSWTMLGPVSRYVAQRYGLNPAARAVVWSGDNPNSVIGTGLTQSGRVAISLGTSDTYFGVMAECRTDPRGEGHVFGAPTGDYMTLICLKNGSLAREKIRDLYGLDWNGFSAALRATQPGNNNAFLLPWFEPEIVPKVLQPGVRRWNLNEKDASANCRAVVEAQMLALRLHSAWMGVRPQRIHATGGASANVEILQVMADVHACPVFRFEVSNSAALGAALRAAHAYLAETGAAPKWDEVVRGFVDPIAGSEVRPDPVAVRIYDELLPRYAEFEARNLA